ncbi:hypothetical protein BH20ACT13_BH20ACT13_18350 [soil metagenome]
MHYAPPSFQAPHRVLLLAAATHGWYQAADLAARDRILLQLRRFYERWLEHGARLLGSFDDDYFLVGQPSPLHYSIYTLYEVDGVEFIPALMNSLREEVDGFRLDSCFRMEARIGRSLFLVSD